MGWLGDGSHRRQGCQAWTAVEVALWYPLFHRGPGYTALKSSTTMSTEETFNLNSCEAALEYLEQLSIWQRPQLLRQCSLTDRQTDRQTDGELDRVCRTTIWGNLSHWLTITPDRPSSCHTWPTCPSSHLTGIQVYYDNSVDSLAHLTHLSSCHTWPTWHSWQVHIMITVLTHLLTWPTCHHVTPDPPDPPDRYTLW